MHLSPVPFQELADRRRLHHLLLSCRRTGPETCQSIAERACSDCGNWQSLALVGQAPTVKSQSDEQAAQNKRRSLLPLLQQISPGCLVVDCSTQEGNLHRLQVGTRYRSVQGRQALFSLPSECLVPVWSQTGRDLLTWKGGQVQ